MRFCPYNQNKIVSLVNQGFPLETIAHIIKGKKDKILYYLKRWNVCYLPTPKNPFDPKARTNDQQARTAIKSLLNQKNTELAAQDMDRITFFYNRGKSVQQISKFLEQDSRVMVKRFMSAGFCYRPILGNNRKKILLEKKKQLRKEISLINKSIGELAKKN